MVQLTNHAGTGAAIPVFDNWTSLSFKRILGDRKTPGISWMAPTWVGDHSRRLSAYRVLQSYIDNSSRLFLQTTIQDDIDNHREYGDAELIRDQILAALIGDDQEVEVDGADDFDPNAPEEDEQKGKAEHDLQEWYRSWAWDDERMGLKIVETERNAVTLGDGVYTLGWDPDKKRPRLRVFDPGFYFPVLEDVNEDEYPRKVHLAWELETEKPGVIKLRRITWELRDLPNGETRNYPYADKPSTKACYMTDATWTLDMGETKNVDDLSGSSAVYATYTKPDGTEVEFKDVDLKIDFIPVVHVPNTVAILNHFGKSVLAAVLQILDDLANADTDLQAASATTGKPPIALHGATMVEKPTYKPGDVWAVGDGNVTVVDTSASLDALLKYVEALLQRLSVNARVPESVLGRVDLTGNLAGITLALSFGPLETLVREMRLVRDEKYPLLLKFAWRIAKVGGMEGLPEKFFPAKVKFGRFLPSDQSAAVTMVTGLLQAHAISRETGVLMLMAAGFPIEDANGEVRKIQEIDFEGADKLQAATGDDQAVRDYLGLKGAPPVPPPPLPAPTIQPPPGVTVPPTLT